MQVKKGDMVRVRKDINVNDFGFVIKEMFQYIGKTLKVEEETYFGWITLEGSDRNWDPDWLEPALIDNKLNRRLYPNYTPEKGYLVSPKTLPKKRVNLKKGDKIDLGLGYFTAEETGVYELKENGMERVE